MDNDEWIYLSGEWSYLKSQGFSYSTFDDFWNDFNKHSFLVPPDDMSNEDIEKFKITLKENAKIIYDKFESLNHA